MQQTNPTTLCDFPMISDFQAPKNPRYLLLQCGAEVTGMRIPRPASAMKATQWGPMLGRHGPADFNHDWTISHLTIWNTIWWTNIAMENDPFIDGLPIKNGDCPLLC